MTIWSVKTCFLIQVKFLDEQISLGKKKGDKNDYLFSFAGFSGGVAGGVEGWLAGGGAGEG